MTPVSARSIGGATVRALTFLGAEVILVYDLWTVHKALHTGFLFESRGPVEIKSKGLLPTWFLTGVR
jgi:hypothetical protein